MATPDTNTDAITNTNTDVITYVFTNTNTDVQGNDRAFCTWGGVTDHP